MSDYLKLPPTAIGAPKTESPIIETTTKPNVVRKKKPKKVKSIESGAYLEYPDWRRDPDRIWN